jgi:hypothetical protein
MVLASGGTLVELVRDSRTLLLPTDREAVAEALASLKVSKLLGGFRGRPAGDTEAAVAAVLAVAAFAEANRERLDGGFRGRPAGDTEAAVAAVLAVAAFAEANRERLEELEVNPLLVLRDGVVAVDVVLRIRSEG